MWLCNAISDAKCHKAKASVQIRGCAFAITSFSIWQKSMSKMDLTLERIRYSIPLVKPNVTEPAKVEIGEAVEGIQQRPTIATDQKFGAYLSREECKGKFIVICKTCMSSSLTISLGLRLTLQASWRCRPEAYKHFSARDSNDPICSQKGGFVILGHLSNRAYPT